VDAAVAYRCSFATFMVKNSNEKQKTFFFEKSRHKAVISIVPQSVI
jgi:hypothetical protein